MQKQTIRQMPENAQMNRICGSCSWCLNFVPFLDDTTFNYAWL